MTVGSRFAHIVGQYPDRVAIEHDGGRLTYAQLDERVRTIALRLLSLGRDKSGTVAILSENRIAAIAAMLGAARAGYAYVPLDAGDPEERLRYIVQDSSPFVLLTDAAQASRAGTLVVDGGCVLDLDEIMLESDAGEVPDNVTPDSLLYVIYTSGSTGRPKGVMQTHRNLLFFVDAYAKTLKIGPDDRLSLLYTLSFSAANMDIYGALLYGAALCPYDMRRDGVPRLADWIEASRITLLHAVPTVFRELTRSLEPTRVFPLVRAFDLGGEALFGEDVAPFRMHFGQQCSFINHLAATEASVIAQFEPRAGMDMPTGPLPAGCSPEGLEVHILRPDGEEASANESGLIAIDSPYLSPGYWHRPDLDAEVFSELPERPGWRRYKSGDLGRIDAAGNLHFLGREGSRIKLRGQSVDLNEVEAALLACEGVSSAAVLAQGPAGQEAERLLAFIATESKIGRDPLRFRKQMIKRLPAYMLPGGYIFLDSLPTTATGKVDRRALAGIDLEQAVYRPDYEDPADDIEQRMAAIFSQVLKYSPVGRHDDFFLLGGDSVSLVELQLQMRQEFGKDLPDLHEDATVAGLAARLRESGEETGKSMPRLVPLRRQGSAPPLYLVHGRLGQAHVSPYFLSLLGDDQPLYALQARGLDGLEAPCRTVREMAEEYVRAVRQNQTVGPYFLGSLCAGGYVAIEMARILREAGEEMHPLLLIDPPAPPFRRRGSRLREKTLLKRMLGRRAKGQIDIDLNDSLVAQASVRVARAFQDALAEYRQTPYDGLVFLLASRKRLAHKWKSKAKLLQVFGNRLYVFPIADAHNQMMDPRNLEFGRYLSQCAGWVREGTGPPGSYAAWEIDDGKTFAGGDRWWRRLWRLCRL